MIGWIDHGFQSSWGYQGVDFPEDFRAFGVVGFAKIMLGLELDEEIPWDAEAGLKAQGDGGTDAFALANDIAELGSADVHGSGGLYLGDLVMFQRVPNEGGGGVGNGLGDFGGVPWNGARSAHLRGRWFGFHWRWGLVGVFDFDELDVFHFFIFPLEGDAPRGFAGVCIDRVAGGALELVVVEGWGE